jgi:hypothetical protein
MMLIHRRALASGARIGFAHVSALFRVPVIVGASEMIDMGASIDPDDSIGRTTAVRLLIRRKLAAAHLPWQ